MKSSKKLLFILVIVFAIIVVSYYYNSLQKPISKRNDALIGIYKVLSDESVWRGKMIKNDNPSIWNVPIKNIEIKEVGTQSNFYCGDKKAGFVNYSSVVDRSRIGEWDSVFVVDCGDYYFVYEYSDAGPKLFGPFDNIGDSNNRATSTIQDRNSSVSEKTKEDSLKSTSTSSIQPLKRFLKILYPNGGETLAIGSTQQIEWSSSDGLDDKVTIEIFEYIPECYLNGKYICSTISTPTAPLIIADKIPNMGKYNWVVGKGSEYVGSLKVGKKYKLNILGKTADTGNYISDSSDNYFTVTAEKLKICPDNKVNNQMPTVEPNNNPPAVYFNLNGERRELSEFDLGWVEKNCAVKEQIVY